MATTSKNNNLGIPTCLLLGETRVKSRCWAGRVWGQEKVIFYVYFNVQMAYFCEIFGAKF